MERHLERLMNLPCIHNGALPGTEDQFRCRIAYRENPTREYCQDYCPKRVPPGVMAAEQITERRIARLQGGYPGNQANRFRLGDITEALINVATLGQGKRIAKAIAKKRGKADCGCQARKEALNRIGSNDG